MHERAYVHSEAQQETWFSLHKCSARSPAFVIIDLLLVIFPDELADECAEAFACGCQPFHVPDGGTACAGHRVFIRAIPHKLYQDKTWSRLIRLYARLPAAVPVFFHALFYESQQ